MKIATWNVNSINARLPTALDVLKTIDADVVCLQELKCEDGKFPRGPIEDLGFNVETYGQKAYNGVALLSKHRFEDVSRGLPSLEGANDGDEQARYIEALIAAPEGPFRVGALYAPNGNPVNTDKFTYKLSWMARLTAHAKRLLAFEERFVLAGDYNIIPRDGDADDAKSWEGDALFMPEAKQAYRRLINLGLVDAFMQADGRAGQYTFWDYQAGAWRRNHGVRIDFVLCSPQAADGLEAVAIPQGSARNGKGQRPRADDRAIRSRAMKSAILRILGDFLSTIAFVVIYYTFHDVVIATGFAIALGIAQIIYLAVRKQPITAMQWMSLGLVVVLGGLTMWTANSTFIRFKASIAHFAIATVMSKRGWQLPYMPPIVRENVTDDVIIRWGYAWCGLVALMGLSNIAAAIYMNMDQWTLFIAGLGFAKLAIVAVQMVWIRAKVRSTIRAKMAAAAA